MDKSLSKVVAISLLLLAGNASADILYLDTGGRIEGRIVERTSDTVTIELGAGTMSLDLSTIVKIEEGRSLLDDYDERAAALADDDIDGWLALGDWAAARGLGSRSRSAFERVLALDPENAAANEALGRVEVDGRWLSREDAYLARGYIRFEGKWMLPEQQAAIENQRLEDAVAAEARARAREAEARARAAEARAREAEARAADDAGREDSVYWGYGPHRPGYPVRPLPPDPPEPEPELTKPIKRPLER